MPAATESLRLEAINTARINRPVPPLPAKGMYYPRLEIEFATIPRGQSELVTAAADRLRDRIQQVAGGDARLTVRGRVARLEGTAQSAQAAELATILAGFEPGIDEVQNALQVQLPAEAAP